MMNTTGSLSTGSNTLVEHYRILVKEKTVDKYELIRRKLVLEVLEKREAQNHETL